MSLDYQMIMNKTKKNLTEWDWRDLAFVSYFLSFVVRNVFDKLLPGDYSVLAMQLYFLVIYLLGIRLYLKDHQTKQLLPFVIAIGVTYVLLGVSYWANPGVRNWMVHPNWGVVRRLLMLDSGIYIFLMFLLVDQVDRIFRNFQPIVLIGFLHGLLQLYNAIQRGGWDTLHASGETIRTMKYSMSFGYRMTLFCLVSIILIYAYRKKWFAFIAIPSFALSILYGSRGVILNYAAFCILFGLVIIKGRARWIFANIILSGATAFLLFIRYKLQLNMVLPLMISLVLVGLFGLSVFRENVSLKWNQKFITLGLVVLVIALVVGLVPVLGTPNLPSTGSRNIDNLLSGNIADQNGRDQIWLMSWNAIKQIFPLGAGAYGDRPVIVQQFAWGYSHNIVLEMVLSFGVFGVIGLALFSYLTIRLLCTVKSTQGKLLLLLFISLGVKLLISDSFWYSDEFWGIIGLINLDYARQKMSITEGLGS